jgi:hypothetical protein
MIVVGGIIHASRHFIGRSHKIGDMNTVSINGEARPGVTNACLTNKWRRTGTLGKKTDIGNNTKRGESRG